MEFAPIYTTRFEQPEVLQRTRRHREQRWVEQLLHGAFPHNLLNHPPKPQGFSETAGPTGSSGRRQHKWYYLYVRRARQFHLTDYASP